MTILIYYLIELNYLIVMVGIAHFVICIVMFTVVLVVVVSVIVILLSLPPQILAKVMWSIVSVCLLVCLQNNSTRVPRGNPVLYWE